MAVRQLEDAEVGVGRRVAWVEAERRTKCRASGVDVAFGGLNGAGEIVCRSKHGVGSNGELNGPAGGREILVQKLRGCRVVVGAAAVGKRIPERLSNGVEIRGIAGVRVERCQLFERARIQ